MIRCSLSFSAFCASWLGLTSLVSAEAMLKYDRVVDVVQKYNLAPNSYNNPGIDNNGNLYRYTEDIDSWHVGDYRVGQIKEVRPPGGVAGYTLFSMKGGENLLPPTLNVPSARISQPNVRGDVVGGVGYGDSANAFYFSPGTGELSHLNGLPGARWLPDPSSINGTGQIVGSQSEFLSFFEPGNPRILEIPNLGESRAIFYESPDSDPVLLSTLLDHDSGWTFRSASGINDLGEIVGFGINPQGRESIFILEPTNVPDRPVPEPNTLIVLTVAGTFLAGRRLLGRHRLPVNSWGSDLNGIRARGSDFVLVQGSHGVKGSV